MNLLAWLACAQDPARPRTPPETEGTDDSSTEPFGTFAATVRVTVTLDGDPAPDALVSVGGLDPRYALDASGQADVPVVFQPDHEVWLLASHPDARIRGVEVEPGEVAATVALERFDPADNVAYAFGDPGAPDRYATTDQCAHCHKTINAQWHASPHRTAASNPSVHDLYAGTAPLDPLGCVAAGGVVADGPLPGGGIGDRCFLGDGALPAMNACDGPCEAPTAFGACADCHAPGIDGALGGRDLHEATGLAFDEGVHCDVCHKVEAVDPLHPDPGVAGKLHLVRPSEPDPTMLWTPLMFGPYDDVPNVGMGAVHRTFFHEATLCAGCHEHDQPALVPGTSVDPVRWPTGRIPVHSTYSEWLAGPFAPSIPCQTCHMPPDATVGNSADLTADAHTSGPVGGWPRPAGTVREHSWVGPRQPASRMLQLAATLDIGGVVEGGVFTVTVTTTNSGPGHALPTGEPLRAVVLQVEATCDGIPQPAIGGDVVPPFGGSRDQRLAGQDVARWPGATPGEVLRVLRRTGGWVDYAGPLRFGDGSFEPSQKGLAAEVLVGERTILAVDGDVVTLDAPLPDGDLVVRGDAGLPTDGSPVGFVAGAPGWAWGRILADGAGRPDVPHALAVDVPMDNRLPPGQAWTSTHVFQTACDAPAAHAVLAHRAFPPGLVAERGWDTRWTLMAEVTR